MDASRQLAGGLFEKSPRLVAELRLPLSIESGLTQRLAERRRIDVVENKPLGGEVALERRILLGDFLTLRQRLLVDDRRYLVAQIGGNARPHTAVDEEPPAVPHMVGERAIFLHFIELCGGD